MQQKRRWQRREWLHPEPARPDLGPEYGQWFTTSGWEWWGTFTFSEWVHPEWAGQRYERWAEELAAETGFKMQHARALEYQRRGVVHFHSLIWGVKRGTSKNAWAAKWQEIGGGWASIKNYNKGQGAAYYLGKYLVKGGEVDMLTFGGSPLRPDDVRITKAGGAPPAGRSGPR